MKGKQILLGHGSGGQLSHELIKEVFVKHFNTEELKLQTDSAILNIPGELISFTTDSYVVNPIFFSGGNIGKLAIAGTVNDLAVSGAKPLYISSSFIIEEGFPIADLEKIVATMADEARKAGVKIVTGDTKVVDRGKCDKIFINTSGIGVLNPEYKHIGTGEKITPGDIILINGSIGDHGMTIMAERNDLNISAQIGSDCAPLNHLISEILETGAKVRFMRDATRGGIATVLTELSEGRNYGLEIDEEAVPVKEAVRGICELLGFDPFYVANEGKIILVVAKEDAEKVLEVMKKNEFGKESAIIGKIVGEHPGKGWIHTGIGGKRIIDMLSGEQLPRIC
ncbi:MAG: hydrogenase expression/formation protein HypE [Bacteroidetes bacterium GWF2_38_335]|nr:MAG: hydrogenase expression/formation protein HypE [Bacteroidetes bacterium GWF2_38_335]OFY81753.1 MAG: hydrogenase expression/formation protein HypE [Bacteroidetes bacterium RIFOXYA12_FULL_38_20]HBS87820.1 hydrogenase expression/formation protein HypE [Bacteroidales bacterium]